MRGATACVLLVACSYQTPTRAGELAPDGAAPIPPDADAVVPFRVRVEAAVDGRSRLVLHERELHWTHHEFAAPGRLDFEDDPTRVDGVDWFPTWPDIPNRENRNCNCASSSFMTLPGRIPRAPIRVTLTTIMGRSAPTVVEAP